MKDLQGKIALVTGASRGLGRGIALVLAEKGATVVVNYRGSAAEAAAVVSEIRASGGNAVECRADVSESADVDRLFAFTADSFGRLDILVNNAGTSRAQDIFETSEADWDFILKTNLKSHFLCTKRAMELMRDRNFGRIINMTSMVAHRGALFGHCHYAATKGGILSFTRTIARTGAPFNITCNAIAPGIIETELLFRTHGEEGVAKLAETVPLGLGKVRDVGLAAAYLAGEGGNYLTGICLDVNGGMYFH
ncbi:MAG: 3-oxoacyl-ACP reductase FabG [Lentisphaeria bacterium]|nr:3-oxoacyl-ACP reductase FabG [Lentisphaeria bacterium]